MTRVRLPFLVALGLAMVLLVVWLAAGAWLRHARRQEHHHRAVVVERLQSAALAAPLIETEGDACPHITARCLRSPLGPRETLPAVIRTLHKVGHVTDSGCGRAARTLVVCDVRAEVEGVQVLGALFSDLDVRASRKANSPQFRGSIADLFLVSD